MMRGFVDEKIIVKYPEYTPAGRFAKVTEHHLKPEPIPDQATLEAQAGYELGLLLNYMVKPAALAHKGGPLPVGLWAPWTSQATLDRLSAAINARFVRSWACQHLARQCNYTKLDLWWLVRDPPSAGAVAPPPAALPPADAVAKPAQPTLITPSREFNYRDHIL